MSLSFLQSLLRKVIAVLLIGACPLSLISQDTQNSSPPQASTPQGSLPAAPTHQRNEMFNYAKPKSHFPNPIAPYVPHEVSAPDLTNSPKLDQLMREGKIYLSMDDAVALALENNLDIAIQRYNAGIADTEVMRAKSGANQFFGVQFGVVQNTPGGGVGGLSGSVGSGPGGTSSGAGGIGAGTLGITSTEGLGPLITSFDPIVTGTLQFDHESGVTQTLDPLGGSYFLENLTLQMEQGAFDYFGKLDTLGGMVKAIERGYPQKEIAEAAYSYQRAVEAKEKIIVGVNEFVIEEEPPKILYIDETVAKQQSAKLKALRARRSNQEVRQRLDALKKAAAQEPQSKSGAISSANTMPYIIEAVRAYATIGEICDALREVYGTYVEVSVT